MDNSKKGEVEIEMERLESSVSSLESAVDGLLTRTQTVARNQPPDKTEEEKEKLDPLLTQLSEAIRAINNRIANADGIVRNLSDRLEL